MGCRKLFFSSLAQLPHIKWVYSWMPEISRIIKLAKPLELFLSYARLCLAHLVLLLFPPSSVYLDVVLSSGRVYHFDLPTAVFQSSARVRPIVLPVCHPLGPALWLDCQSELPNLHASVHPQGVKDGLKWSSLSFGDRQGPVYGRHPLPHPHPVQLLGTGCVLCWLQ